MRVLIAVLAISLPAFAEECVVEGLGKIELPKKASCKALQFNFALARSMVLEKKWADEAELEKAWGGIAIEVQTSPSFVCLGRWSYGCFDEGRSTILLGSAGKALLHELLHVLQWHRYGVDASMGGEGGHRYWEQRGWHKGQATFEKRFLRL